MGTDSRIRAVMVSTATAMFFFLASKNMWTESNVSHETSRDRSYVARWGEGGNGNVTYDYLPSNIEKYIMDHSIELGYDKGGAEGCLIWKDETVTPTEIRAALNSYAKDLANYSNIVNSFVPVYPDLLEAIVTTGSHDVCVTARPHPDGIQALFPSNQLSLSKSGFIEPLTPPMRDHMICENFDHHLMHIDYLVHDFEAMCRKLKPWSKRILIDMGASLEFHSTDQPIVNLINQYEKFGFVFDHIYGFEIQQISSNRVYEMLPEKLLPIYHWINVGVSDEDGHKLNPLHSILKTFREDDFIVVKLDIDTPWLEDSLVKQLLDDKDGVFHKLVDQFYFEHHVHLKELERHWGKRGTVKDSLDLFYSLREKGIPSHFWP